MFQAHSSGVGGDVRRGRSRYSQLARGPGHEAGVDLGAHQQHGARQPGADRARPRAAARTGSPTHCWRMSKQGTVAQAELGLQQRARAGEVVVGGHGREDHEVDLVRRRRPAASSARARRGHAEVRGAGAGVDVVARLDPAALADPLVARVHDAGPAWSLVTRFGAISLPLPTITARFMAPAPPARLGPDSGSIPSRQSVTGPHCRGRARRVHNSQVACTSPTSPQPHLGDAARARRRARAAATCRCARGKIVKTIFFDHGRVVFAASNLQEGPAGRGAGGAGPHHRRQFDRRLRPHAEATASAASARPWCRPACMDKNELGRSVARQVRRIVLSLFEFTDGAASFEERPSRRSRSSTWSASPCTGCSTTASAP